MVSLVTSLLDKDDLYSVYCSSNLFDRKSAFLINIWKNKQTFESADFSRMQSIANFSVINHSIFAFGKHDAIGFVDVESGQVTFHHVIDEKVTDEGIRGISCISGNTSESIYAIGDISSPSRIILYSMSKGCMGQLRSKLDKLEMKNIHLKKIFY